MKGLIKSKVSKQMKVSEMKIKERHDGNYAYISDI